MTATELQNIVLRLANSGYVRYWLHWNYPHREPWVMAVSTLEMPADRSGLRPVKCDDLIRKGFEWDAEDRMHYVYRTWDPATSERDLSLLND